MEDFETKKFESVDFLEGLSSDCPANILPKDIASSDVLYNNCATIDQQNPNSSNDKSSDSESFPLETALFSSTIPNYANVTETSLFVTSKTSVVSTKDILSLKNSNALSIELPSTDSFSNNSQLHKTYQCSSKENYVDSHSQFNSEKKLKLSKSINKSPKFNCLKCKQGYSSKFLCEKCNLPSDTCYKKTESASNNSEVVDSVTILSTSTFSERENYRGVDSLECTSSSSECQVSNLISSNLLSRLFLQEQEKYFSPNKKDLAKKSKMQCKNDLNDFKNINVKLSKSLTEFSLVSDAKPLNADYVLKSETNNFDSQSLTNSNMPILDNAVDINPVSLEISPSKMPLSQGTKNFLNELAASNVSNTYNDNVSGYALSTLNSPLSCFKSKKNNESDSNDNQMKESILNETDQIKESILNETDLMKESTLNETVEMKESILTETDNVLPCVATDPKDLTNALELIEQSSLQDRDLSSAEICSSLNQIFCESSPNDLPTNIVASEETEVKTEETNAEYETITLNLNDPELLLQGGGSNICLSADNEGGTINLADLCPGSNFLLIQDESGNVTQVFMLPEDAQIVEDTTESNNVEILLPGNNTEISEVDQSSLELFQNANNVSMNESSLLNSVLDTQDVSNSVESVLLEQGSTPNDNNQVLKSEDSSAQMSSLLLPNAVNMNQDLIKLADESITKLEECSQTNIETLSTNKEIDISEQMTTNDAISSLSEISADNYQVLSSNHLNALNNVQESSTTCKNGLVTINIEETLSKQVNDLVANNINESVARREFNVAENAALANFVSNPEISVSVVASESSLAKTEFHSTENAILANLAANPEISVSTIASSQPSLKAKKSFSKGLLENELSKMSQNGECFMDNIANSSNKASVMAPVNGAVYQVNSADRLSSSTNCSNLKTVSKLNELVSSQLVLNKTPQKSKKSISPKLLNRSAKKSFIKSNASKSSLNSPEVDSTEAVKRLSNETTNSAINNILRNNDDYVKLRNLILKRRIESEDVQSDNKRSKSIPEQSIADGQLNDLNGTFKSAKKLIALKTFKKPFTAAKKSVFNPREMFRNVKNTALKTCVPKSYRHNSAMKSFPQKSVVAEARISEILSRRKPTENIVHTAVNSQKNINSNLFFQREICEIRILPDDYVKRASNLLLKKEGSVEPASTPENVSDEEIRPPVCDSPLKEIMQSKPQCSCTAKEVPCLCYDDKLQLTCEAEDTVDEKVISCTNYVSQQYLLTPSSELKHRAFCDIHLWRLRQHHCCPKCGVFCSQGEFSLCSHEVLEGIENHLFHTSCFIVPFPGLPPGCPHCCRFSNFSSVYLIYKSLPENEQIEVPSNSQNITSELEKCDIFLTVKQEVNSESKIELKDFQPGKKEIELMIRSLAKEKTLRLRPTGKCLYNPIKIGDVQKVMQLIGNGVNPNHKFRMHRNNSPLHVAAHNGWTGILHILLQAGALIDSVNDDLETPLIVAVERNQLPIVRYLILAGAQIDVKDCNGMTSFHIASKNGFKEIAEFLFNTGRIDVNLQDDGGWTALVWACEHKHVDFVKWLLDIGSDPNVRDNEDNTVLHWAAYSGKCEIAELLLDKGCTLSYVNKRGDSVLHIAAREDNYDCVKLLISRGAVLDQKNRENKTPLMCCQDDSMSFTYLCQVISSGALKIGKKQLEKHVVFRDISRGAEVYPIQAINEVDDEEFIMEFRYVIKQCQRLGVDINSTINSMQFCYCKDNCITRDCNCIMSSQCWYDSNGCLTSEYDLENLPAIFECNKTCHCPKTCINRVIQNGLRFPLQIFRTRYQGWGVRALQDIPKGAFVCEYVGELITSKESLERGDDTYYFDLESEGGYCLDGRYFGNVARFLNHSCEPNLMAVKAFVDHQDLNFPRIALFALNEIQAYQELCFDYGLHYWTIKSQSLLCTCQTQSCRYSKDTIDDTLFKYFMHSENGEQMELES